MAIAMDISLTSLISYEQETLAAANTESEYARLMEKFIEENILCSSLDAAEDSRDQVLMINHTAWIWT